MDYPDAEANYKLDRSAERFILCFPICRYGDMPDFYRKADVLLITLRGDNSVGNTMPGKLQTYMTCGKPIFGAINGASDETIFEAHCGSCVPAGDYEGLAKLMEGYISNPSDYEACGQNARTYFKAHFTLKHYCDSLERLMESIINEKTH